MRSTSGQTSSPELIEKMSLLGRSIAPTCAAAFLFIAFGAASAALALMVSVTKTGEAILPMLGGGLVSVFPSDWRILASWAFRSWPNAADLWIRPLSGGTDMRN